MGLSAGAFALFQMCEFNMTQQNSVGLGILEINFHLVAISWSLLLTAPFGVSDPTSQLAAETRTFYSFTSQHVPSSALLIVRDAAYQAPQ